MVLHPTGFTLKAAALLFSLGSVFGSEVPENFKTENLVAWCVVPFDSESRNPTQRVEMLRELGLGRVAYDWRERHVAEFEEEILAYRAHDIQFFAFWRGHEKAYDLFEQYDISPQIWRTVPSPRGTSNEERVEKALEELRPIADRATAAGLPLGLYNHGGWGGLPENMITLCEALREEGHEEVGLVYNFHHAHPRIDSFASDLRAMMPYLLCVNLNGMLDPDVHDVTKNDRKIRPIGSGDHEARMILTMINLGYEGPVGILGHVGTRDVKEVLQENLDGLETVLSRMR